MEGRPETPLPECEFEIGRWRLTEDSVRRYLDAVGDDQQEYFQLGLVPPLFLTAPNS